MIKPSSSSNQWTFFVLKVLLETVWNHVGTDTKEDMQFLRGLLLRGRTFVVPQHIHFTIIHDNSFYCSYLVVEITWLCA